MTTLHSTRDEAIAQAFAESEEGDEVAVHEATCGAWTGGAVEVGGFSAFICTCTPTVHVVRKGAA